jgi:hypothetical protein
LVQVVLLAVAAQVVVNTRLVYLYRVMQARREVLEALEKRRHLANGMLTQDEKILVEAVAEENPHTKPTLAVQA